MGASVLGSQLAVEVAGPRAGASLPVPAVPVLPARLTPPALRAGIVTRNPLIRRLRRAAASVVAIVAPPGYGKTTVLAQWATSDRRPFAWLSLDRRVNDPAVLVTYLACALGDVLPVDPAIFENLVAPHQPQRQAVVAALASSAARTPQPFVLAIDDAHLLTETEGVEAVATLVDHLPHGSQLALAGRYEPGLSLPRLRAEGRVDDVGTDDLRLDPPAARELLAAAGVELSGDELGELVSRTEGWAAGLYLAALARQAAGEFPALRGDVFEGDDRLLADYLRSEILDHLPSDQLAFLTRTSVLDELCGPLCDAVLEQTGSAAVLEEMEASNLLVVPLDRQRRWYRYHHLFQAMLRHELDRTAPQMVPALALRASAWCEDNGLFDSAAHYAQLAGDASRVGQILLRGAMRQYAQGRAVALREWFAWLAGHGCNDGGVAVLGAWLSLLSGMPADAERWAAVADAAGPQDAIMPDGSPLTAWVLTLRAAMALDVQQMSADAQQALRLLAPSSQWRPTAASLLGSAELFRDDLDAADRHLADAAELGAILGGPAAASAALATRAVIAIRRDHWHDAAALLDQASAVIRQARIQSYATTPLSHAAKAQVAIHSGDPWTARQEISAAYGLLPLLTRAISHLAIQTRLELARACISLGDANAAEELLGEAHQLLRNGRDFGSLRSEAQELGAAVSQIRAASQRLSKLTPAELRLLPLLATQHSFPEIAEQLFVSVHTIKAQVTSIYRKLDVSSRSQAIDRARELSLLPG
jgi:LuxR family maltose regulon positive regulatory protein